jgi:cation:H+ antiporter
VVAASLALIVLSVLALWAGARAFVDGAVRLARRIGLSELVIGLTIVAVGTSLPELVVTGRAALAGASDIAVGNVVGSNVYNLAFVLGLIALISPVAVSRPLVRRDGPALLGATLLAALVLRNLEVTRLEGFVLVAGLIAYLIVLARAGGDPGPGSDGEAAADRRFGAIDAGRLVGGLALVLVGGHLLVVAATDLARAAGIAEWAIGATVVAAGTSTPELVVSVVAITGGRVGVSVGNLLGSSVFNVLGVLGVAGLFGPLTVAPAALADVGWLSVLTLVVVLALWSGHRLSRAEGGLLLATEALRWLLELLGVSRAVPW